MNYFAHGQRFLDDPYFVAGTAVPDWLNVVDRRVRARSRAAAPLTQHEDQRIAAVARGIVQHHHDDAWFHQTPSFVELNLQFTVAIRDRLAPDDSFRPSFLGHILVELLLDDVLITDEPERLDEYYRVVAAVDPQVVTNAVAEITQRDVALLAEMIRRFGAERFLCDYADDGKLLRRLNAVMRRVRLPELPVSLQDFFPEARRRVAERKAELLAGQ